MNLKLEYNVTHTNTKCSLVYFSPHLLHHLCSMSLNHIILCDKMCLVWAPEYMTEHVEVILTLEIYLSSYTGYHSKRDMLQYPPRAFWNKVGEKCRKDGLMLATASQFSEINHYRATGT